MKHAVFGRKLGRNTKSRKALLNNLAGKLIMHGSINTTLVKAKFIRPYMEKMVTIARKERLASQRILASSLPKEAFKKLSEEIAPGFTKRSGGYTRIVKLAFRKGDAAPMARIEFVKWEQLKVPTSKAGKSKKNKVKKTGTRKLVKKQTDKVGAKKVSKKGKK